MKRRKSNKYYWGICLFLLVLGLTTPVIAQLNDSGWETPENLSQSGSAELPSYIQDASGTSHLFWQDTIGGASYQTGNIDNWSEPVLIRVPFTDPAFETSADLDVGEELSYFLPTLILRAGTIFSFWIDEDDALRQSRVLPENITAGSEGWSASVVLTPEGVVAFDVGLDENGRLHLVYIQSTVTDNSTSGLYHQFSDDGGAVWSSPTLLYGSNYFRDIDPTDAQVSLKVGSGSALFLTWDDRLLEQLFFASSSDGGESWSSPEVIDRREESDPTEGFSPANLKLLVVNNNEIHLSWVSGDDEDVNTCNTIHQFSLNGGASWSEPAVVLSDSAQCAQAPALFQAHTGLVLLMTVVDNEGFLQAWDGERWTKPDPQPNLGKLQDPTTFRNVILGCRNIIVTDDNQLVVIGCGTGTGRDIWQVQRPLGELSDWFDLFEATPIWSDPVSIISSQSYLLPGDVVAGADGRIHAFFSQSDDVVAVRRLEEVTTEVGPQIFYARLNNGQWGAPRPIIESPTGKADQLVAAADERGRLFIAWSSGKDGGIYLSRSNAERASSATEWTEPVLLPAVQTTGSWPDILVEGNVIYVAYTIPLNEDRGIYITRSEDGGNSWSDPLQVFNGEDQGWQLVGRPKLARTLDGVLHITWTRDIPTSNSTLALVYAQSGDDGHSWTEPEVITEETVIWADIVGIGTRTVHRTWQALSDNRVLLWHQVSFDSGLTWDQPVRVSNPAMDSGPAAMVLTFNQSPHLLQLAQTIEGELFLLEWTWDGARWQIGEELELSPTMFGADALSAVYLPENLLGVLYGSLIQDPETEGLEDNLLYTSRLLDETAVEATPLPTLTPTAEPSPTVSPTPAPSATPTISFAETPLANNSNTQNSRTNGILFGLIPAVAIVGIVFGAGLWWSRRT